MQVAPAGFDMGSAVPVSEPDWSAAHRGLCLYANRLLAPVAEQPVVQPMKTGKLLKPTFAPDVLQARGLMGRKYSRFRVRVCGR